MKRRMIVLSLICIDLIIKLIIFNNFMNVKIKILGNNFGFVPYLNKDQLTIFNRVFNLGVSTQSLIIFNIISIVCLPFVYRYILKHKYTNKYFDVLYLFMLSGVLCSFIDKVFFSGSLDYILFFRWIVDLKDIYISIAEIFLVLYTLTFIKHEQNLKKVNTTKEIPR